MRNYVKKILFTIFLSCFMIISSKTLYSNNEKNIIIAQGARPKSLDPHMFNSFSTLGVTEHIYNTLVTLDDKGIPVPEIAKEIIYESPTKIIFTIRDDIKFHNGKTLNVDDVIFSLERMLQKPGSRITLNDIKNVKKISDEKVAIELHNPSAPFLSNLTLPTAAIMNKEYILSGENIATLPMGTGPYMLETWGDGEKIVLKSFDDYFKGKPKNTGIVLKTITENSSRLASLETGEVDIIYPVAPVDLKIIEKNDELQIVDKKTTTMDFIQINTKKELLNNKSIRKALHLAIDKQGILDAILYGRGSVATSSISPHINGSYQKLKEIKFSKELAKSILNEEIKKNKLEISKIKIWTSEDSVRGQIAQIIQANLKDIGIDSEIEILEWGTMLKKTAEGEHDIAITTWILGVNDIDTVVTSLFHTNSIGSAGNRSFYSNKNLDEKIEIARSTLNQEERKEKYKEIQEIVLEENPIIPLFYRIDALGINKRIKNFNYNKSSMRNYYENIEKMDK